MQKNIDARLALQKAQQAYQQKQNEFHNDIKKTLFLQKVKKYEAEKQRNADLAQLRNEIMHATMQGNHELANQLKMNLAIAKGTYTPITTTKTSTDPYTGATTVYKGTYDQIQNLPPPNYTPEEINAEVERRYPEQNKGIGAGIKNLFPGK